MTNRIRKTGFTRYFQPDSTCILYAPLWWPELGVSPFTSREPGAGTSCTVTGAVWGTTGYTLDGSDDVINCGSGAALDAINATFAILAWVNPVDDGEGGTGRIFDKETWHLRCNAGVFRAKTTQGTVAKSADSAAYTANAWNFVAGVLDGSNMKISLGGTAFVVGDAATATDDHSANTAAIGDIISGGNRCFNGVIGEVMVYNRALSISDVQDIYQKTKWRYNG